MKPVEFDQTNVKKQVQEAITDLQYDCLHAHRYGNYVTTLWKPSFRERLSILFFGRIWLTQRTKDFPFTWIDGKWSVYTEDNINNCCARGVILQARP